jgi:hypothetical protein
MGKRLEHFGAGCCCQASEDDCFLLKNTDSFFGIVDDSNMRKHYNILFLLMIFEFVAMTQILGAGIVIKI